ncbi:MAG: hypothetical protein J5606_07975, partial [Bacteroidales bacterium]|nr:hypothetical protein [Bacteroidales bacterium]
MKKSILLFFSLLVLLQWSKAQTTDVCLYDPTQTIAGSVYAPMYRGAKYSYTRMLYTAAEVGGSTIYGMAFKTATACTASFANQSVYVLAVDLSDTTTLSAVAVSTDPTTYGAQLVWSSTVPAMAKDEWLDITFTSPFTVASGKGLVVYWLNKGNGTTQTSKNWYQSVPTASKLASYKTGATLEDCEATQTTTSRPLTRFNRTYLPNSVSLNSINSPADMASLTPRSYTINVTIQNKGSNNLNCTIKYSINGGSPVSYSYIGNLTRDAEDNVTLPSFALAAGDVDSIKVWVENPNGEADLITYDDTLNILVVGNGGSLSPGTYTIGPTGDYATLNKFFRNIQFCDVTTHGTWTIQMQTGTHAGLGRMDFANNVWTNEDIIVLTSATGDAADVTIATDTNVIVMDNNYNVTVKDLTLTTASDAPAIEFTGPCYNVEISNCIINLPVSTTTTSRGISYSGSSSATQWGDLRIKNNTINNGCESIFITYYNPSTTKLKTNASRITIENNTINNFYRKGIYISSCGAVDKIAGNVISTNIGPNARSSNYGIAVSGSTTYPCLVEGEIIGNKITYINPDAPIVVDGGIMLKYLNTSSTGAASNALVANNEIIKIGNGGFYGGVSIEYVKADIYHNTVYFASTGANGYALCISNSSATYNAVVKNNIFYASSGSSTLYAVYVDKATFPAGVTLDYNDYYTTGTYLGACSTSVQATTLAAWQTASGQDANSINQLPLFTNISANANISNNNSDIKVSQVSGVDKDIKGISRLTPTRMGAYEYVATISDGTNGYMDLAEAINACNTTGVSGSPYTLTLSGDASIGTTATIDKNITINVVSNTSGTQRTGCRAIATGYINSVAGTLNISDIILDGNKNNYTATKAMLQVAGTVSMNNCTIQNCANSGDGGAIYMDGGTLTVTGEDITNGLRLEGNEATNGGGLFFANGTITDNSKANIVINKNMATYGGGIYCEVNTTGAKTLGNIARISENTASGRGGGIFYKGYSNSYTTTFSQAITIQGNTADTIGGGLYVEANPIAFASTVDINNNTTTKPSVSTSYIFRGGAGIYNMGTLSFTGGNVSISNNTTQGHGAGIYNYGGSINCTGGNMTVSNNATRMGPSSFYHYYGKGGGIFDTLGTITIGASGNARNLIISDNIANTGGGLQISSDGVTAATLTCWGNITISGDSGKYGGGGIYNINGTVDCKGTMTIDDNGSYYSGGGIYNHSGTCNYGGTINITNNYQSYTSYYGGGVYNNATTTFSGATTIDGNHSEAQGGGVYNNSSLTFNNNVIISNNYAKTDGGGIFQKAGTLTLKGSAVKSNEAKTNGGGIYVYGGTFTFASGTNTIGGSSSADKNTAVDGAGLYVNGGTVTVTVAPVISHNVASSDGGGVYTKGTINFASGTEISANEANNGGGIYISSNTTTFNAANIKTNKAISNAGSGGNGGGIYVYGGTLIFATATSTIGGTSALDKNEAVNGAGIYYRSGAVTFTIAPNIKYNEASGDGGGIYFGSGTGTLTWTQNPTIEYNKATSGNGGGIYTAKAISPGSGFTLSNNEAANGGGIYVNANCTLNNASITKNIATANGGGIYVNSGTLTFATTASTVGGSGNANMATNGAGIYMAGGTVTFAKNPNIKYNEASGNGGGIYISAGTLTVSVASTISYNTATGNGGGVYWAGGTRGGTYQLTLSNNTAANGGGMYVAANISPSAITVTANTATSGNGGGLYIKSGTTTLNGTTYIRTNTATNGIGGGIYVDGGTLVFNATTMTIGGSSSYKNQAQDGAGIYVNSGNVTFTKAPTISYNEASRDGGGIYFGSSTGTLTWTKNPTITYNKATSGNGGGIYTAKALSPASGFTLSNNQAANGGGIYVNTGTTTFNGANFANNTASVNGGAIYLNGGGLIFSTNPSNIGSSGNANSAADGGGMYIAGGTVTFTKAPSIAYNTADGNGGGIYTNIAALDLRNTNIQNNTAGSKGGGVFVNDVQNAGDYTALKVVKVGGSMKLINNTVSGDANNLYVRSRNNIQFVETFADTSSVGVYCVRSATAY